MRTIQFYILAAFILLGCFIAQAQPAPTALLSRLPAIPSVSCDADVSEIEHFSNQIHQVEVALDEAVEQIHAEAQAKAELNSGKMKAHAMRKAGLNEKDAEKLEKSKNKKEEGRKLAEKMIGEKYGHSLGELEKVGEMSEAEQEKWAQQYAGDFINQSEANPATPKQQNEAKRMFELGQEQKSIAGEITAKMERASKILNDVNERGLAEEKILEEKIRPLEKQLCSGICTDAEIARSNAAEKQIHALKIKFCEKMSPLQTEAISQYLTTVKTLLPMYLRLTEIQNEIAEIQQLGEIMHADLSGYEAVDEYAVVLQKAYKYWVGEFNK